MNNYHFPQLMPGNQVNPGMAAGPSNRGGSSMGHAGANNHTIGSTSATANPTLNVLKNGASGPAFQQDFDPITIAQSLSSVYASAIADIATHSASSGSGSSATTAPSATVKGSNAAGKSTSNTPHCLGEENRPVDHVSLKKKMHDLRKTIRDIISSVWADTECGRSAGMAGVTVAEDDVGHANEGLSAANDSGASTAKMCLDPSNVLGSSGTHISPNTENQKEPSVALSGCGDRRLDDHLINIFLDNVYHQLPIILRSSFSNSYSQGKVSSLLVCAMCAAASVFLNRIEGERTKIYEQYSQKVREKFHDACFEPSLEIVQTSLIMTLCEYRHGSLHRAWVYLSMGFRLAIAMGYHHLDDKLRAGPMQSTAEITRREGCRRAFWGAFLLDRYIAIGGGKALGINDHDISVLLPLREEDWRLPGVAPPLSTLEFFKPVTLQPLIAATAGLDTESSSASSERQMENISLIGARRNSTDLCMVHRSPAETSSSDSPLVGAFSSSRHSTPTSAKGWNARANDASALSSFVKLMAVIGQVAQHVNSSKVHTSSNESGSSANSSMGCENTAHAAEKPTKRSHALNAALLRWKEELPISLSYYEAKSSETNSELSVFISCMHAIYHGAVIMLNRENMSLLRDLPGQLDVSSNLAIRSLERCRVAAMQVVEISHHICSLPTTMTNALLPWALFQAGTLLIHFMIAGSTPQAQEEARAAILSLDCALRDDLSRYWNVSAKYHLVLSNMVKAWERTRNSTPNMASIQMCEMRSQPQQQQNQTLQGQAQNNSGFTEPATDLYSDSIGNIPLPLQMQLCMQLPIQGPTEPQQAASNGQYGSSAGTERAFPALMKPYSTANGNVLGASGARSDTAYVDDTNKKQAQQQQQQQQQGSLNASVSNFLFTSNTAQDSMNTLNEFFSQLSQEQVRQITEGLQAYSVQNSRGQGLVTNPLTNMPGMLRATTTSNAVFGLDQMAPSLFTSDSAMVLTNAAVQSMHTSSGPSSSDSIEMAGNGLNRLQDRRGSIPISSNGNLFTTPGVMPLVSQAHTNQSPPSGATSATTGISLGSEIPQVRGDSIVTADMLDPLLFNPMTPFLQEMQLFNDSSSIQRSSQRQQQQQQQSHNPTATAGSVNNSTAAGTFGNSNMRHHC
ncbi:hypothetical protein IWW48_004531 [Coemansia sp. RSA 1200]|nr:hypothetical protein IWW48_004531 [Coemansia sp. RSA 1200]